MSQVDDAERQERLSMIAASAAALVPRGGDLARVRRLRFTEPARLREHWPALCAQGWPGLLLAESAGGSGLGLSEYCALLEALGAGLVPEPLVDAVLAAALLPAEALPAQLSGERLSLPAGLFQPACVSLANGRASGRITGATLGACADAFVLPTDHGLVWVQRDSQGLSLSSAATQDGGHSCALQLNAVAAQPLAVAPAALQQALDAATLGHAAYLLGCMQGAFERTLDYLKVRRQFGRPIGSFQVLQHRMVDLKIQIELSRAIIASSATAIDQGLPAAARPRQVSAAKLRASRAALQVCREAIQLHGAIGYTDEADIGLFLRKALVLMNAGGTLTDHEARYSASLSQEPAHA